jgi:hypothetical protein
MLMTTYKAVGERIQSFLQEGKKRVGSETMLHSKIQPSFLLHRLNRSSTPDRIVLIACNRRTSQ